jgi:tetratricopeptide (TPR) repeat protein
MKKIGKLLSWFLLAAAVGVLFFIGVLNLYNIWSHPEVRLKEVAYGIPPETKILKGRPSDFKKELKALPPLVKNLLDKAEIYWKQKKYSQAITNLDEALKIDENTLPVYNVLADYLQNFPDTNNTIDTQRIMHLYEKALEKDQGHPLIRYDYGRFLWQIGDIKKAVEQYEIASDLSPSFPLPYISLGRHDFQREKYTQAKQKFKTAISLLGGGPEAPYDYLAFSYYQSGRDDSASMVVNHAKQIGLQNSTLRFVEGLLWEAAGQLDLAAEIYRKLLEKSKARKYNWALTTLGKKPPRTELVESIKLKDSKWEEATAAIEILDPLVKQFHANAPLWLALGKAYMKRELYAHSVDCFDSSLKYDPEIPQAASLREQALAAIKTRDYLVETEQSDSGKIKQTSSQKPPEEKARVVMGHYHLHWGVFKEDVFETYPSIVFQELENGNLLKISYKGTKKYETLLGFREGRLWGIRLFITDTAKGPGDLFGESIGLNSRISGEGKSTGSAYCQGYAPFQGVIWENEDTFEIMIQFKANQWHVRMARVGKDFLPGDQKLCDYFTLVDTDTWK